MVLLAKFLFKGGINQLACKISLKTCSYTTIFIKISVQMSMQILINLWSTSFGNWQTQSIHMIRPFQNCNLRIVQSRFWGGIYHFPECQNAGKHCPFVHHLIVHIKLNGLLSQSEKHKTNHIYRYAVLPLSFQRRVYCHSSWRDIRLTIKVNYQKE